MSGKQHYLEEELYHLIKSDDNIFNFIQEGSLDGMWYWDLENPEHEWMSPRFWETLGYNPKEMKHLAYEWQDIIFQEDLKIAIENFHLHVKNPNHPYDQIVRYRHKNGSTVWIRCRGLVIKDKENNPIRMIGAHNDFTSIMLHKEELEKKELDLQKTKELLIEQSKSAMLGEMLSIITHQWKQPISILSMMNTQIEFDLDSNEIGKDKLKEYSGEFSKQIQYLSSTIDTFRDFFNPDKKRINARVSHIIEDALEIISKSLLNNNIEVVRNYKDFTKVNLVSAEFMQIILNIIGNAKDAFNQNNIEHRKIWIHTHQKENYSYIEIEDSAGGIPETHIDKIFNQYYTTKTEKKGSGLGLYIVKLIVEEHFLGTIQVKNTKKGAKFIIKIPV